MSHPMLPIAMRPLQLRDFPQVLAIEQESFEHPWSAVEFYRAAKSTRGAVFVAEVRGGHGLVGYFAYTLCRRRLLLTNFAVDVQCRRRGVGTQMADWLMGKADETGRRMELEVRESNLTAQLFWRRCGLKAIGIVHREYPQMDESAIVMEYSPGKPTCRSFRAK